MSLELTPPPLQKPNPPGGAFFPTPAPTAAPPPRNLLWGCGTAPRRPRRPPAEQWFLAVRSASRPSTKTAQRPTAAPASRRTQTAGGCPQPLLSATIPPQPDRFALTCRPPPLSESAARRTAVDENCNNVSSPSRGLAGKLQQLLTPTKKGAGRRAASVDDRRPGGGRGIGRRVSDQRQSRKAQVAETLLKAKERLVNATSEVRLRPDEEQ